jgi:CheY-like chemotaxis protein
MAVVSDPPHTPRVLVVDDDAAIRELLYQALADEGYAVCCAADGEKGLALLEAWHPHVILLDLMMPGVDGWTFRARQLASEGAKHIPVVVLSAAYPVLNPKALKPAAVVGKPFDLDRLLQLVTLLAA